MARWYPTQAAFHAGWDSSNRLWVGPRPHAEHARRFGDGPTAIWGHPGIAHAVGMAMGSHCPDRLPAEPDCWEEIGRCGGDTFSRKSPQVARADFVRAEARMLPGHHMPVSRRGRSCWRSATTPQCDARHSHQDWPTPRRRWPLRQHPHRVQRGQDERRHAPAARSRPIEWRSCLSSTPRSLSQC
jgi:hypothetical protein